MAFSNLRNSVSFLSLAAFAAGTNAQEAPPKPPQTLPPVVVKKEDAAKVKRAVEKKQKAPAPVTPAAEARPAAGNEPPHGASDEGVVYSANRAPTDITKVGSAIDIITSKQIDAQSRTYVQDYLAQLPGINVAQQGPFGSTTTYSIWGAYQRYIKVQVDGIDIADPIQPQPSTALENLLAGDVGRIEVLKGSQSLLYGGEAVGGVISIDTAKPVLGPSFIASGETGAYNTQRGLLSAGYGAEDGWARISVQSVRSDGYPALDIGRQDDSSVNQTFSGVGEYKLSNDVKVFFSARSADTNVRYDSTYDGWGLAPDGWPGTRALTSQQAGRLGTEFKLFDGALINTVSIQGMEIDRKQIFWVAAYDPITFNPIPGAGAPETDTYKGDRWKIDYLAVAKPTNWATVTVGADHQAESATATSISYGDFPHREAELTGVFGQLSVEPFKALTLTGGGRDDDHSTFGDHQTYRFTGAYFYEPTETKLRASTGTGFRTPSLYELYSPFYGNPSLKPEESQSWDAGFDQWFANRRYRLSATYFQVDTTNEIGSNNVFQYIQIPGVTHREGVELSGAAALTSFLSLSAGYTYVDARQDDGVRLVRIPRNSVTLGADALLFDTIKANVTAKAALDAVDTFYDPNPPYSSYNVPLKDYVLLNAKFSYDIRPGLTAYIRGENLLNQKYETVLGYNTPGLSVYTGLTISLDSTTLPVSLK